MRSEKEIRERMARFEEADKKKEHTMAAADWIEKSILRTAAETLRWALGERDDI